MYIFVCVLAYRLFADLKWSLQKLSERKNVGYGTDELGYGADEFLHDLGICGAGSGKIGVSGEWDFRWMEVSGEWDFR